MLSEKSRHLLIELGKSMVSLAAITPAEFEEYQTMFESRSDHSAGPELFTVEEVARLLKIHRKTVYDFIYEGKLERKKFGRRSVRITGESLRKLLQTS
jgi:DNA binding domain, excisionase family